MVIRCRPMSRQEGIDNREKIVDMAPWAAQRFLHKPVVFRVYVSMLVFSWATGYAFVCLYFWLVEVSLPGFPAFVLV